MDRTQFLMIVNDNTNSAEQLYAIHTAFDAYCAARIADSQCSTLRMELAQMLMEEQQKASHLQTTVNRLRTSNNIDALQRVISLMDARQPVA